MQQPDFATFRRASLTDRIAPQWRLPLAQLTCAWAILFALFASDWAAMASQWWNSSTYNHILLVPAILAWLVWQRAEALAVLTPRPFHPALLLVAGSLFFWLLGDISGTATIAQLGVVAAMQSIVIGVLGVRVAWALAFPLGYALFLVPIGEELVPALQMITAHITIALTQLSGIPALIDGVFIDTPAGLFEVAEACSGVKFLIAMIALGVLVAHVCFRSWWRRMAFMALAIGLPIIANGIRAWGTIYIAQSQGIAFAQGFDHVVYGWFFFAVVMAALLLIGSRFFDRDIEDGFVDPRQVQNARWPSIFEGTRRSGWLLVAGTLLAALSFLAWSYNARALEASLPAILDLPPVEGWSRVEPATAHPWRPSVTDADHVLIGSYGSAGGRQVEVVFALYGAQEDGREAGAFGQGALPPDSEWRWLGAVPAPQGGQGERLQALGSHQRVAYTWYRHGDWTGSSRTSLKLRNMTDRLLGRAEPTAMLILSADTGSSDQGEEAIAAFLQSTGPVDRWMDAVAQLD